MPSSECNFWGMKSYIINDLPNNSQGMNSFVHQFLLFKDLQSIGISTVQPQDYHSFFQCNSTGFPRPQSEVGRRAES